MIDGQRIIRHQLYFSTKNILLKIGVFYQKTSCTYNYVFNYERFNFNFTDTQLKNTFLFYITKLFLKANNSVL